MSGALFRQEVVDARRGEWLGSIIINRRLMACGAPWPWTHGAGNWAVSGLWRDAVGFFFRPLRCASEEQIVCGARQQSELLESIRGAMPIKLANKQSERLSRYANATVSAANRDIAIQRLNIAFSLSNQLMFGIGRVAMIWIAAVLALDNTFTAGALIAFIAYADQFTARAVGLIDKWVDFSMLKLHAERVADIALTQPEKRAELAWSGAIPEASVELCNVSFRYADDEPWILKNCSFKVEAGESVVITGSSGCGKSTLSKIVLGLLTPTEGVVKFGGIDIRRLGLDAYRQWTGAAMQDDQLFAGSIADNICFFNPEPDMARIFKAAQIASIHADIMMMPMAYESLVGDMGSTLSGGQKQRVILARAIYRNPKLLVLDEATSHLDARCECLVNEAVARMNLTKLVISHRATVIKTASRELVVSQGKVILPETILSPSA